MNAMLFLSSNPKVLSHSRGDCSYSLRSEGPEGMSIHTGLIYPPYY